MEGSRVGSGGCVVRFDGVGCCNVVDIMNMVDMVRLDCMQKLCSA